MAKLTLKGDASGSIDITVPAAAGANIVTFPAATGTVLISSVTMNFPTSLGAVGDVLTTDGAGNLSWSSSVGMVYPAAGVAVSTGTAWDPSITLGSGVDVALAANVNSSGGMLLADGSGLLPVTLGGTGLSSLGSAGQVLTVNPGGTAAVWASSGIISGTTTISSGAANGILYDNSGTLDEIATANGGILNTDASGVPSITSTPTLGVPGVSGGSIILAGGIGFGTLTLQPQTSASGTLTIPNGNGVLLAAASTLTQNSVLCAGASGVVSQNNSKLFYDATNDILTVNGNAAVGTTDKFQVLNSDMKVNSITVGRGGGSGATNTAIGDSVLSVNTADANLTGVGVSALQSNVSGTDNTALGAGSLFSNASGSGNTAAGVASLQNADSNSNTAFGMAAGISITTGSNNVYVGNVDASSASVTDEIVIGTPLSLGKGANTAFINPNGGAAYQGNNSSAWAIVSDERVKKDIVDVKDALAVVNALRPVHFKYKLTGKSDTSFIAQEYVKVLPDQVNEHVASPAEKELTGSNTLYGIQTNLIPYLVKAIQELSAEVEALKVRPKTTAKSK